MSQQLVGRKEEKAVLLQALEAKRADMISVIGRRRVGKTFLIRKAYEGKIDFEMTGIQNAPLKIQLQNFAEQLGKASASTIPIKRPTNWLEAFSMLENYLASKKPKGKKVVFLDELPWIATRRSGFLQALGHFWNNWAVKQNIVVVICGSAASWMIQKVVNHKGSLHNRITKRLHLEPFTLKETKLFLQSNKVKLNHFQIIQLYMVMGGVPHYLKEIVAGRSASQNIDQICFSKTGLLKNEFSRLYQALFDYSDNHILVVRTLAKIRQGLTRQQLIDAAKLPNGGGTTKLLDELIFSGFVSVYLPFGKKKKDQLFRLTDEYSLFYLQFIEKYRSRGENVWQKIESTQKFKTWSGYAFENICLTHTPQLKKALGISGIYSSASSFIKQGNKTEKGAQIDLVIDRSDQTVNLFEIKFHKTQFSITKAYAESLREKTRIFQETTQTKKLLFLSLITTFGLTPNEHSIGLVDNALTMDDLFNH